MPISDNLDERLKAALVPSNTTADNGAPVLLMGNPAGWTVGPSASAVNAAQTLTQVPDVSERALVTGIEVGLFGVGGAKNEVTINLLGSGATPIYGTSIPSGNVEPVDRDFSFPLGAGLAATVQLYVGPAGASMFTRASLRGYSVGGI